MFYYAKLSDIFMFHFRWRNWEVRRNVIVNSSAQGSWIPLESQGHFMLVPLVTKVQPGRESCIK